MVKRSKIASKKDKKIQKIWDVTIPGNKYEKNSQKIRDAVHRQWKIKYKSKI